MPYIAQKRRDELDARFRFDQRQHPGRQAMVVPGELAYVVARVVAIYLRDHGHSFSSYAAVAGALELSKHELVRRVVGPYEDDKLETNGDVYDHAEVV